MVSEFEDLAGLVRFQPQPSPLPSRLSPSRRIALLLLSIDKCWGRRATQLQIHALDTAIVDPNARAALAAGDDLKSTSIIRYDPALPLAVDRAVGFGLIERLSGNRLALTSTGAAVLGVIRSSGALSAEQALLDEIPGRFTQTTVDNFVRSDRWL